MEQKKYLERRYEGMEKRERCDGPRLSSALSVVGGLALLGLAALVVMNLPDLKRYIKISTM